MIHTPHPELYGGLHGELDVLTHLLGVEDTEAAQPRQPDARRTVAPLPHVALLTRLPEVDPVAVLWRVLGVLVRNGLFRRLEKPRIPRVLVEPQQGVRDTRGAVRETRRPQPFVRHPRAETSISRRPSLEQVFAASDGRLQDQPILPHLIQGQQAQDRASGTAYDVQNPVGEDKIFGDEVGDPARVFEQRRLVEEAAYVEQGVRDRAEARRSAYTHYPGETIRTALHHALQRPEGGPRQLAVAGARGEPLGGRQKERDAARPAVEVVVDGLQLVALRLGQVLGRDPRRAPVLGNDRARPDRLRQLERLGDERFVGRWSGRMLLFLLLRNRTRGRTLAGQVGVQRAINQRHLMLKIFVVEPLQNAQDQVEARLLEACVDLPV